MTRLGLISAACLVLGACSDETENAHRAGPSAPSSASIAASPQTVVQFLENPAVLDEMWARCRNDPGGIGKSPDCVNAAFANERLMILGRERAIESLKR